MADEQPRDETGRFASPEGADQAAGEAAPEAGGAEQDIVQIGDEQVPLDQVVQTYVKAKNLDKDYTQKMQALAEQRRALEAREAQMRSSQAGVGGVGPSAATGGGWSSLSGGRTTAPDGSPSGYDQPSRPTPGTPSGPPGFQPQYAQYGAPGDDAYDEPLTQRQMMQILAQERADRQREIEALERRRAEEQRLMRLRDELPGFDPAAVEDQFYATVPEWQRDEYYQLGRAAGLELFYRRTQGAQNSPQAPATGGAETAPQQESRTPGQPSGPEPPYGADVRQSAGRGSAPEVAPGDYSRENLTRLGEALG